jgi:pyrroline-5-carboxylate reductase
MSLTLLVAGGGRMGSSLLSGLLGNNWAKPAEIGVIEPLATRRRELTGEFPGVEVLAEASPDLLGEGAGAVLAVTPEHAEAACRELGVAGAARVLSIVAGMPTGRLEQALPAGTAVIRAMPNTAALIRAGVSGMSGGSLATSDDLDWAEGLLEAVGKVVRVPERQLDAVTGLSGSGPAYLFLVAEALIEAGVLVGLSREVSETLTVETFLGSARLLVESGDHPSALRADVTSPGGTTAAGLRALEARAVRSAFVEAVATATERSRNLAR